MIIIKINKKLAALLSISVATQALTTNYPL